MSDDWGDLENLPEPKSGAPKWLWACGCGCLLVLILMGSGLFWGANWLRDAQDPVRIQASLESMVEFDELPEDFSLVFGNDVPLIDLSVVVMISDEGDPRHTAMFLAFPDSADGRSSMKETFDSGDDSAEVGPVFEIEVQGRSLSARQASGDMNLGGFTGNAEIENNGHSLLVDVSSGGGRPLLLIYSHGGDGDVPPEAVVEFLEPFHIGPDR